MNSIHNFFKGSGLSYTLALGLSLFSGCRETKIEYSPVLYEDATVVDVVYVPSRHGSGAGPTFAMDFDGNPSMGIAVTSVEIDENYAVVFKCQHGKFISEGSDERHKDLWKRMAEEMEVDVTYKEIYRVVYDDIDKDGKKEVIEKVLTGRDFLDAQPKTGHTQTLGK